MLRFLNFAGPQARRFPWLISPPRYCSSRGNPVLEWCFDVDRRFGGHAPRPDDGRNNRIHGYQSCQSVTIALKSSTSNTPLPGYIDNVSQIGTFALGEITNDSSSDTAAVGWSYILADNNPVLQSLAKDQTLTQIYTITIRDTNGTLVTQDISVTLVGTNDGPTIMSSSNDTPTLTEDSVAASNLSAAGTITFRDVDLIDTHNATIVLKSSTSDPHLPGFTDNLSQIGTFALISGPSGVSEITTDTNDTATAGWSFTVEDDDPMLQSLALGETVTQVLKMMPAPCGSESVTSRTSYGSSTRCCRKSIQGKQDACRWGPLRGTPGQLVGRHYRKSQPGISEYQFQSGVQHSRRADVFERRLRNRKSPIEDVFG